MNIVIVECAILALAFAVFAWAILLHCKKGTAHLKEQESDNVVSIYSKVDRRLEDNLQDFLHAEEALLNNQVERYMALKMRAIDSAKRNLQFRRLEGKGDKAS